MKVFSFRCDEKIVRDFQKKYFGLMSRYIVRALIFALQSENNFNMVLHGSAEKSCKDVYHG